MTEAAPAWPVFGKSLHLCERRKLRGHGSGLLLLLCGPDTVGAKSTEGAGQSKQTEAAGRLPVDIAAGLAARGVAERKGQRGG